MQLHIEGRAISVLHLMGEAYTEKMDQLRKKMLAAKLSTKELDADVTLAGEILEQSGYKTEDKARVEVTRSQIPLPFTDQNDGARVINARVKCINCARMFAVPPGDTTHGCPDCGTIHRVKADNFGEIFFQREVALATPAMLDLIRRSQAEVPDLTLEEAATLAEWLKAHPDYVVEAPESGMRVADPAVPGSGNPLRFDCRTLTGKDCDGFDGTDTPGSSVCPSTCGSKFTVEIVNGIVLQRPWRPEDDEPVDVAPGDESASTDDEHDEHDDAEDDDAGAGS